MNFLLMIISLCFSVVTYNSYRQEGNSVPTAIAAGFTALFFWPFMLLNLSAASCRETWDVEAVNREHQRLAVWNYLKKTSSRFIKNKRRFIKNKREILTTCVQYMQKEIVVYTNPSKPVKIKKAVSRYEQIQADKLWEYIASRAQEVRAYTRNGVYEEVERLQYEVRTAKIQYNQLTGRNLPLNIVYT